MSRKRILESYRQLYEQAMLAVKKNPDGSVSEADLLAQLKLLIVIDEDADRERKAKHMLNSLCRAGLAGEFTGQLCFPGYGTWGYDPDQLIRSGDGNVIKNQYALHSYKVADAQRSATHMKDVQESYRRKRHEADVLGEWTIKKLAEGTPQSELTWGKCIEELGIHDPLADGGEEAEPDSDDE